MKENTRRAVGIIMMLLLVPFLAFSITDGRSTSLSFDKGGNVVISRSAVATKSSTQKANTWTIFVYLCGADLESDGGAGSTDINEMISAATNSNIQFIVQTGGAKKWQEHNISAKKLQRYLITGGKMTLVNEVSAANMGSKETLASFLSWGLDNYSSANNGLVFWDHGGGSLSGVCFDEKYDDDSLTLIELDQALTSVHDKLSKKFEFIGFDACLMGTIEVANMLVPHANYMIASEELEPGYGWFYKGIGQYLNKNPGCTGAELGVAIADSFYEGSKDGYNTETETTLSVIDLSKIDALIVSLNKALSEMYEASADASILPVMTRKIKNSKNFGGNSRTEGYTNMVDLGGILSSIQDYAPSAKEALKALSAAVIYNKTGKNEKDATGLSTYYPLSVNNADDELEMFRSICVSPYYLTFIDKMVYGSKTGSATNYAGENEWLGGNSSWWSSSSSSSSSASSSGSTAHDQSSSWGNGGVFFNFLSSSFGSSSSSSAYDDDYSSASLEYLTEPALNRYGDFTFTLTPQSLDNLDGVYCSIMMIDEEGYLIDLGLDNYVDVDWDEGVITDIFDGTWYFLSDGQVLAMYLYEEGEDYDMYTSPIQLNGKDTNLRIMMQYTEDGYDTYILGTNSGVSGSSFASGRVKPLKKGDVIVPAYYIYDFDYEYEGMMYGSRYRYRGDDVIYDGILPDGDYDYYFQLNDIYGNEYYSDSVTFNVEGEDVYYYY